MNSGLLTSLIFLPLVGAGIILLLPDVYKASFKWINLICNVLNLINALTLYGSFNKTEPSYQFLEHYEWIRLDIGKSGVISIDYVLGLDGINLPMVILSAIILLIGGISSFSIVRRPKAYYSLFLLLCSSVMGCFVALDLFLFFLFFEFMLLPMYFLIGIWGGENREYASLKFIIYTLVGSVLILIVMIAVGMSYTDIFFSKEYGKTVHTFDFRQLKDTTNIIKNSFLSIDSPWKLMGIPARELMFVLLFIGFGIKLPMVPFHTWLPDAHVEAPTAISVILAGVLLKIGGYGLIRIGYGFFPDIAPDFTVWVAGAGVLSIIYGALNALAQTDLKKLIAYSSVSHMGFVLLGISALNAEGINGAVYQMFSHGILSAMLFLCAGVIYDQTHNREIANYRGLAKKMPFFTVAVSVAFFGSLGLPTLSGFIGEFFSLLGAFQSDLMPKWMPVLGVLGIVLSAVYLLWTFQKMFFGEYYISEKLEKDKIVDLDRREMLMLTVLGVLAFLFGIFPNLIFDISNQTVQEFLTRP